MRCASSQGRSINALDEQQRRKVALIGQRVRDQLFAKDENPLGADITINGISFQVIGVFESLQNGNQQQEDESIYLPNDTLRYAFNQIGWVGSFVIVPKAGHARRAWPKNEVKNYLAQIKKVSPDDKGVFGSFNLQDEYDKVQGLFTGIKVFSWMVAIGTIFAGAVGVGKHHAHRGEGADARDRPAQGAGRDAGVHRRHDHPGVAVHHRRRRLQRAGRRRAADRMHREDAGGQAAARRASSGIRKWNSRRRSSRWWC